MLKPTLFLALLGGVAAGAIFPLFENFNVRFAHEAPPVTGIVVEGKHYVPLQEFADRLGAKAEFEMKGGNQEAVVTLQPKDKRDFDESLPAWFTLPTETPDWQVVPGSGGKIRARDFIHQANTWEFMGEIEVIPQSIFADGRIPRGPITLTFYVTLEKGGKTLTRFLTKVENVSFDGGRYPIKINSFYGNTNDRAARMSLRFNGAREVE